MKEFCIFAKRMIMNTKTIKPTKEKSWTLSGVKLTHKEFIDGIHKAEEGPLYIFEELQGLRKQWRNLKKNL